MNWVIKRESYLDNKTKYLFKEFSQEISRIKFKERRTRKIFDQKENRYSKVAWTKPSEV